MTTETTSPLRYRDDSIRPQDDLYRHSNGKWFETATIPGDQGIYGSFMELRDQAEDAVHAIIKEAVQAYESGSATDGATQRIAHLYGSFMNEAVIEERGAGPIAGYLQAISEIQSVESLLELSGSFYRKGISGFLEIGAMNDAGNPERNLLTFLQGGLGLPDESYYHDEQLAETVSDYREHLVRLLSLGGFDGAEEAAAQVVELETAIAEYHWDRVKVRDAQARYNLLSGEQLFDLFAGLKEWLSGAGIDANYYGEVVVWQPSYLEGLSGLVAEQPLEAWKNWLRVQVLRSFAPYLSSDFVNENFSFYSAKLGGVEQIKDRWKRGVAFTEGAVGEDIGQLYVAENFPPEAKAAMDQLVQRLIEAYRISIGELSWMGEQTIEKALDKLSKFRPKIGYPNEWIDYSSITTDELDVIANLASANEFEFKRELKKIDDGVNRELWFMYPQTVNAYYHPLLNEIAFPAAILRLPFFDVDRDIASNFGAIGAVIGHEIGHGFDDQGSQFDGSGQLTNWWTDDDRAAFEKLTGKLVEQYNALSPTEAPEHNVNGALTLGENIGDLGGLGIAYKAYKLELAARGITEDEVIDGVTGDQRFFYSWAECWRTLIRPETAVVRVRTDPHAPGEFRCNQVPKNLEAFHEAFGTKPGDGMWLDPAQRVEIW
ncbi:MULTISPECIES: M13 family metallopeptidase [Glutamicibacter]|uniref:Peptidase M13 n=1 Tax=Glutamicibacter halophytocola TaxID=1933880 RepID=A0A5B8IRN9_9MICC|nr:MULTISPECIES: M13-type metalloendopeptidase [Glutamicibacter]MBF6673488.1 peptidase M13 [Glutamicibacter sp. FBE19]NQD42678.1 peptidase M13 [Glutamicibacter halophytocola]QDY67018.1 peptidase M13 [Glutamicibacter halophytocola]UUX59170.1 peptidase M13 [Glutamicibacter halophytocola]